MIDTAVCDHIAASFPDIVRRTEAAVRAKDIETFRAASSAVRAELDAEPLTQCPSWRASVEMQRALLDEYTAIFTTIHDADGGEGNKETYGGHTLTELLALYSQIHGDACVAAVGHMDAAWTAWRGQDANVPAAERLQRYLSNVERDDFLVRPDGSLGAPASPNDFLALVHTPVSETLASTADSLQGQGPMQSTQAVAYVNAALHYAQRNHIAHVRFVNTAGGQVPSFLQQVDGGAHDSGVDAEYIEFDGWGDGSLVTPEAAAAFAKRIADRLGTDAPQRALLVVNCNAGMDRSGTMNVLTQLVLQTRHDLSAGVSPSVAAARGFAAIPEIVSRIKRARPRAISSPGRFIFLYRAYAAYLQSN